MGENQFVVIARYIFFFFDTVDILEKEFLLVNGHCLNDEFEEYWWKTLLKYPHSKRLYEFEEYL